MTGRHDGPWGRAEEVAINPALPGAETTTCVWLLTGPWHPVWIQFALTVGILADVPGVPPAKLHFPGATHELQVVALNPEQGIRTVQSMHDTGAGGWLRPIDVVHQFTATDDEMREVAGLCARACVDGRLTPSTDDARERLREVWLGSIVRTLAHIRGEEHAR